MPSRIQRSKRDVDIGYGKYKSIDKSEEDYLSSLSPLQLKADKSLKDFEKSGYDELQTPKSQLASADKDNVDHQVEDEDLLSEEEIEIPKKKKSKLDKEVKPENKTTRKQDKNDDEILNYVTKARAKTNKSEKLVNTPEIGLKHSDKWYSSLSNMVETYKYVATTPNISSNSFRAGVIVGSTVVNAVGLSVAAPFGVAGGVSLGVSKLFGRVRKWCFKDIPSFKSFEDGVLTVVMAPIGTASLVVEKTTGVLSKACLFLASAPLSIANSFNKHMTASGDLATKSDIKENDLAREFKGIDKERERTKKKLEKLGRDSERLRVRIRNMDIIQERKSTTENLEYRSGNRCNKDLEKLRSKYAKFNKNKEKLDKLEKEISEYNKVQRKHADEIKKARNSPIKSHFHSI